MPGSMAPIKKSRNTTGLPLALNPLKSKEVLAVLAERNQAIVPVGAWVEPASPHSAGIPAYTSAYMIEEELKEQLRKKQEALKHFQRQVKHRVNQQIRLRKKQQLQKSYEAAEKEGSIVMQSSDPAYLTPKRTSVFPNNLNASIGSARLPPFRMLEDGIEDRENQNQLFLQAQALSQTMKQARHRLASFKTESKKNTSVFPDDTRKSFPTQEDPDSKESSSIMIDKKGRENLLWWDQQDFLSEDKDKPFSRVRKVQFKNPLFAEVEDEELKKLHLRGLQDILPETQDCLPEAQGDLLEAQGDLTGVQSIALEAQAVELEGQAVEPRAQAIEPEVQVVKTETQGSMLEALSTEPKDGAVMLEDQAFLPKDQHVLPQNQNILPTCQDQDFLPKDQNIRPICQDQDFLPSDQNILLKCQDQKFPSKDQCVLPKDQHVFPKDQDFLPRYQKVRFKEPYPDMINEKGRDDFSLNTFFKQSSFFVRDERVRDELPLEYHQYVNPQIQDQVSPGDQSLYSRQQPSVGTAERWRDLLLDGHQHPSPKHRREASSIRQVYDEYQSGLNTEFQTPRALQSGADQEEDRKERQKQYLRYRRLFMDMEREQVKEQQRQKEHRKKIEKIKKKKERQRYAEEQRILRMNVREEPYSGEKMSEILAQLQLEEIKETREKQQREKEYQRYVEALRAQIKEKIQLYNITLPPLCCCGPDFWDAHPDTCANNCIFYKNHRAYTRALHSVINSCDIPERNSTLRVAIHNFASAHRRTLKNV